MIIQAAPGCGRAAAARPAAAPQAAAAAPAVIRPFPTLSKFRSLMELLQWYTSGDPRTGEPSPEQQEDASGSQWRRGGKQATAVGGKSNRQRWHELATTVMAIRHEADKRNQHRGRKVSPEKVADELDARRRGEGVTVANFCKQLIKEYREQVPAAQRGTKGAAKEAV